MNVIESAFGTPHVLLPVVHVRDTAQAVRNATLAQAAGADGIFLIGHGMPWHALVDVFAAVRASLPTFWVGLNFLDLDPATAARRLPASADGLWSDSAALRRPLGGPQPAAETVRRVLRQRDRRALWFGGVAFKHQHALGIPEQEAQVAAATLDVVTTSGSATGRAARPEKLARMRAAIGTHALGVASGIDADNVDAFLPTTNAFLVATGISTSFHELDPHRCAELARRIAAR